MESPSASRWIDLAISVRLADVELDAQGRPRWKPGTDVEIALVGGCWDRRRRRWAHRPTARTLPMRFHRGQEQAARWFAAWLARFVSGDWADFRRVWSALLIGGRRSGKTHLICAVLVLVAILRPRSRLWAISPTLETGDELEEAFKAMLPRHWYVRRQAKMGRSSTYTIANGSRILLKSGVKPERLKAGRADVVLLNEAQEISARAYHKVRPAVADRGGLVLLAANPPEAPIGRWVEELFTAAVQEQVDAVAFQLDPRQNPWIEYAALASMAVETDEKTYQRDVLGLFPPIGDVVMHGWSDRESVRAVPPGFVDITAEVTRQHLGKPFAAVVGVDLQKTPHMAAAVHRFYRDPAAPDEIVTWVVDEIVVDDADENDLLDALEDAGHRGWIEPDDDPRHPQHCAAVLDASSWWQDGAHQKGKTSDRAFKARNWTSLFKPQRDSDRNPDIIERVKCCNAQLKNAAGRRHLFVVPGLARTIRAMRSWENKNGFPNRHSDFAHLCDAVSYVSFRFFGKPRGKSRRLEYRSVGRFDRADLYPR